MRANATLSRLLIADLAQYLGMTFEYPDRLTRAEANEALNRARAVPGVVAAYKTRSDKYHDAVRTFAGMVNHFASEHPTDATGEPLPWPEKAGTGRQATPDDPFAALDAEDAEARLTWARTRDEYIDAYFDKSHPQHDDYVAQTQMLMQIAHLAPSAIEAGNSSRGSGSPEFQQQVERLMKDPAYHDKHHPDHQRAVDRVTQMYEGEFPPGAGRSNTTPEVMWLEVKDGRGAPKLSPQERIDQGRKDPAYLNKNHPGHAAAVEDVSAAYRELCPEPAAPTGGEPQA